MKAYGNFINGQFSESSQSNVIEVSNPAIEKSIATVPEITEGELDAGFAAAEHAQVACPELPAVQRGGYLHEIASLVRGKSEALARIISEEHGKPLGLARVEVGFAADHLDYSAEWARRIQGEIVTSDRPNDNIFIFRKPIGVVSGILPWNFPFFWIWKWWRGRQSWIVRIHAYTRGLNAIFGSVRSAITASARCHEACADHGPRYSAGSLFARLEWTGPIAQWLAQSSPQLITD